MVGQGTRGQIYPPANIPLLRPTNLRVLEFYGCVFGPFGMFRSPIALLIDSNKKLEKLSVSVNICSCFSSATRLSGTCIGPRQIIDMLRKSRINGLKSLCLNFLDIQASNSLMTFKKCLSQRSTYRRWGPDPGNERTLSWDGYKDTFECFTELVELTIDEHSFFVHWKALQMPSNHGIDIMAIPVPISVLTTYTDKCWFNIMPRKLQKISLLVKGGPLAVAAIMKLQDMVMKRQLPHLQVVELTICPMSPTNKPFFNPQDYRDELLVMRNFFRKVQESGLGVKVLIRSFRPCADVYHYGPPPSSETSATPAAPRGTV